MQLQSTVDVLPTDQKETLPRLWLEHKEENLYIRPTYRMTNFLSVFFFL